MEGLKARGKIMYYLMTNLFNAYHVSSDTEFIWYIKTKKNRYNDREEIKPEKLIEAVLKNTSFYLLQEN